MKLHCTSVHRFKTTLTTAPTLYFLGVFALTAFPETAALEPKWRRGAVTHGEGYVFLYGAHVTMMFLSAASHRQAGTALRGLLRTLKTRVHRPLDHPTVTVHPPRRNRQDDPARRVQATLCQRTSYTGAFPIQPFAKEKSISQTGKWAFTAAVRAVRKDFPDDFHRAEDNATHDFSATRSSQEQRAVAENVYTMLALLRKDEAASYHRTAEVGYGLQAWQAWLGATTLRNPASVMKTVAGSPFQFERVPGKGTQLSTRQKLARGSQSRSRKHLGTCDNS